MNNPSRTARRLALVVACATGLLAAPAQASCLPSTERDNVNRADAVFTGRVLTVNQDAGTAEFRVLSVRKGSVRNRSVVRVYARPYPSSVTIDWAPKPGQRWRVYLQRHGRRWVTNDCLGTRRVT
jgi:hypothetical protein